MEAIIRRLRLDKRGVSNAIVAMLSLVLVTMIVANIVLWSYQMNTLDLDRMQENLAIEGVSVNNGSAAALGTIFKIKNGGPETTHLVSLWVDNSTCHQRYETDFYINSGDTVSYIREDIDLPNEPYIIRFVTERGNIAVYSANSANST